MQESINKKTGKIPGRYSGILKNSRFLKDSVTTMIEQGFSSIASFLTGIIIARATNTDTAGTYALVVSIVLIFLVLQRVIVAIPFNVFYLKIDEEETKKIYRSSTLGLEIILISLVAISTIVFLSFNPSLSFSIISVTVFFMGYLLKDYTRQYFFGIEKVSTCLIMSALQSFLQLLILFILLYKKILTLSLCLTVIGTSSLVCAGIFLIFNASVSFKKNDLLYVWNQNKWTIKWNIGISMSESLKNQIAIWLLKLFVSLSAVGIYTNNYTLAMLPQPIFNGLSQFLLPNFSKSYGEKKHIQILKNSLLAIALVLACNLLWMIVLIIYGNELIGLIYGEEYITTTIILVLFCFKGILTSSSSIVTSILQAIEKPNAILKSLLAGLLSMCTIGAVLIWKYGILGISIAMIIMFLILFVIQTISIFKAFKKEFHKNSEETLKVN